MDDFGSQKNARRTTGAKVITVAWLAFGACSIAFNWNEARCMPLNEWGDALAGFFSPLAFLWLVVGYLQQGDELRLSSKALFLQAKELQNSVEQQRMLVEATKSEVELNRRMFEREVEIESRNALPELRAKVNSATYEPSNIVIEFQIQNIGSNAADLRLSTPGGRVSPQYLPFLGHNSASTFQMVIPNQRQNTATLTVEYLDLLRRQVTVSIMFAQLGQNNVLVSLPEVMNPSGAA